nr:hypothetical protein CFP56_73012 [Quercus suber]
MSWSSKRHSNSRRNKEYGEAWRIRAKRGVILAPDVTFARFTMLTLSESTPKAMREYDNASPQARYIVAYVIIIILPIDQKYLNAVDN